MKKTYIKLAVVSILMLAILILSVVSLTSCGNMSIGPGNYSFKKVHINTYENSGCVSIDKWHENEGGGIEVHNKDCGSMFLSEGTYILLEDQCPICDGSFELFVF